MNKHHKTLSELQADLINVVLDSDKIDVKSLKITPQTAKTILGSMGIKVVDPDELCKEGTMPAEGEIDQKAKK